MIRASNILGCTPWELESAPRGSYWRDWALVYEKANNLIEKAIMDRAKRKKH